MLCQAADGGLLQLRARIWPLLLGVEATAYDPTIYACYASEKHRDSSTVVVDVQRSIWTFTEGERSVSLCPGVLNSADAMHAGWSDEAREAKRTELRDCLNAVVCKSREGVHYYQGLHEIAAVLLFICGQAAAAPLLDPRALPPLGLHQVRCSCRMLSTSMSQWHAC